jgi:glutamate-5-semialdehyde dehydrogenase
MEAIGRAARVVGQQLAGTSVAARNAALAAICSALRARAGDIVAANARDLEAAKESGLGQAVVKVSVAARSRLQVVIDSLQTSQGRQKAAMDEAGYT